VLSRIQEHRFSRCGFLKHAAIRRFADQQIESFGIKAAGNQVRTGTLSGGNLRKALLARELAWNPTLLLAAQPTRGLDVAAARFVHQLSRPARPGLRHCADQRGSGGAFALSDRIAVMYEGRIMDILDIQAATVASVGLLMAGVGERHERGPPGTQNPHALVAEPGPPLAAIGLALVLQRAHRAGRANLYGLHEALLSS
jgi:simple sugar transport system ATP-binding protein